MPDRLTGIEVFAKVAACGSLSAAGRAIGLSQTMVTKHLGALEARLGAKLFHRTTRRLSLTDAGRGFLFSCDRGLLRLNVPLAFGVRQIAPRLAAFAQAHPHVSVELGLNDRLVDLAEEGWDVAIRIGSLRDSSLVARRLAPCRMTVCAAPAYLAAHGIPRTVADLAGHNCLGYTLSQTGADRWLMGRQGEVRVSIAGNLRANNGDALLAAAIAGQGIIHQPSFIVADALRAGQLVALTLDQPASELLSVHAVYLPDRQPPAKVRAFIDFIAREFAPPPPWDIGAA